MKRGKQELIGIARATPIFPIAVNCSASPITMPITTPSSSAPTAPAGMCSRSAGRRVSRKISTKQSAAKIVRQALTVTAP